MLHPTVVADLLEAEVDVARQRLGHRVRSLHRRGSHVVCELVSGTLVRLDGSSYDAEPYGVAVVDRDGHPVPGDQWPPELNHGHHPVLRRPYVCIRGALEYHAHPSHLEDHWDRYRGRIALADLLDAILRRTGA